MTSASRWSRRPRSSSSSRLSAPASLGCTTALRSNERGEAPGRCRFTETVKARSKLVDVSRGEQMAQGLGPGVAVRAVDLARERWALLPDRVDQGAMVLDRADRLVAQPQREQAHPVRLGEHQLGRARQALVAA